MANRHRPNIHPIVSELKGAPSKVDVYRRIGELLQSRVDDAFRRKFHVSWDLARRVMNAVGVRVGAREGLAKDRKEAIAAIIEEAVSDYVEQRLTGLFNWKTGRSFSTRVIDEFLGCACWVESQGHSDLPLEDPDVPAKIVFVLPGQMGSWLLSYVAEYRADLDGAPRKIPAHWRISWRPGRRVRKWLGRLPTP